MDVVTAVDLKPLLNPGSIAVIGASPDPGSLNGKPIFYLQKHGFPGPVYPVNPNYEEIAGLKCYRSVKDIGAEVDLALVLVAARRVLGILQECAGAGVRAAVVFSSGFAEIAGGRELQQQLVDLARRTGMLVCGPNCQGVINIKDKVAASFTRALDDEPVRGPVGFVTQSGAFGGAVLNAAFEAGLGFTYWVSTGNEAVLKSPQVMDYLAGDPDVKIVGAYIEGLEDGREFAAAVQKAHRNQKPVVVLKSGTSEAGQKAAASHTGALAGSARVFEAACRQLGVIRVQDIDEFVQVSKALAAGRLARGSNIGIVTTSGGAGAIMADICTGLGLNIAALQESTKQSLREVLVEFSAVENPVDVTAQVTGKLLAQGPEADAFKEAIKILLADPQVDLGIIILTMVEGKRAEKAARDMVEAVVAAQKPVIVTWLAGHLAQEGYAILEASGVPVYHNLRSAAVTARALATPLLVPEIGGAVPEMPLPEMLVGASREVLTEWESKQLLTGHGIPVARGELVTNPAAAVEAAARIGYPVVMKLISPDITHKTEAGVVLLNLDSPEEVLDGYNRLLERARNYRPQAHIQGILVEEMLPPGGIEVFVGVKEDNAFGPTVLFGLGGIFVEILDDIAIRLAPIDKEEAMAMISEVKGYRLLTGARGRPPADVEALANVLVQVSHLAAGLGGAIREMDINPLLVYPAGQGAKIADALITIKRRTQ